MTHPERRIFVDTSAYIARFFKKDGKHRQAKEIWEKLHQDTFEMITTNHVLDELATLLGRWIDYRFSARRMTQIYDSDVIIIRPDETDEKQALALFQKYADQKISFTDCLSFVVLRALEVPLVFTFDRHFTFVGFEIVTTTASLGKENP